MSTAYDHYIYQLENPEDILRGNSKSQKPLPAFMEKRLALDQMRLEMGEEEYMRRCREDECRAPRED